MNTLGERIKKIIELKGCKTNAQFARELGISDKNINNYVANKFDPKADFFQKLISRYPDVDINWLITGQQSNLLQERADIVSDIEKEPYQKRESNFQAKYYELLEKYTNCIEEKFLMSQKLISHQGQ